jgi:hypothetical protein
MISVAEAWPILAWRRRRQGLSRCGLALGGGPAELGPWRGHDPCRFGAHAEHPAAARREDLEIEVVEPDTERLPGVAQRLLDRLP